MQNLSDIPSRLAMPCPFAGGSGAVVTPVSTASAETTINFPKGFGSSYAAPASRDGKYIQRGEMNGIINAVSRDGFYTRCGGVNTFDADFAAQIGGYPLYAVLEMSVINGINRKLFKVVSLIDNNKVDFTGATPTAEQAAAGITAGSVDGVKWAYLNTDEAVPSGDVTIATYQFGGDSGTWGVVNPLGFAYVAKGGILRCDAPIGDDSSYTTQTYQGPWIYGSGIMYKDLGTTIPASVAYPDLASANGFKNLIGFRSVISGEKIRCAGSSTIWEASPITESVSAGHYIAICQVIGRFDTSSGSSFATRSVNIVVS